MEVMQCDICQGGLESIYLQKQESPELENERPRWSFLLLEGEYKFRGWVREMSLKKRRAGGRGRNAEIFLKLPDGIARTPQHSQRATRSTEDHPYICSLHFIKQKMGVLITRQLMHSLYQFHMSCTLTSMQVAYVTKYNARRVSVTGLLKT